MTSEVENAGSHKGGRNICPPLHNEPYLFNRVALRPQHSLGPALVLGVYPEDGAVALPARGDGRDGGDVDAGVCELGENRQKRARAVRALDEEGLFPGAELDLRLAREGGEGARVLGHDVDLNAPALGEGVHREKADVRLLQHSGEGGALARLIRCGHVVVGYFTNCLGHCLSPD